MRLLRWRKGKKEAEEGFELWPLCEAVEKWQRRDLNWGLARRPSGLAVCQG
jgi:hypothetical protein